MSQRGPLNDRQESILRNVVEIPSYVFPESGRCEAELLEYIEDFLRGSCRTWRIPVTPGRPGRWDLVAEKGSGPHVLWITGHVDTVLPDKYRQPPCKLGRNTKGAYTGLAAWDMKAGIAAIMDVLQRIDVPPWMKICTLFVVGEECNSDGILAAIEEQKHPKDRGHILPFPDLGVYSPEIATNQRILGPRQVPLIYGARGHTKFSGDIFMDGNHGFLAEHGQADIEDVYFLLKNGVRRRLEAWQRNLPPHPTGLQHAFLNRSIHSGDDDGILLTTTREIRWQWSVMQSPYLNVERMVALIKGFMESILSEGMRNPHSPLRRIHEFSFDKSPNRLSYEPVVQDLQRETMQRLIHALSGVLETMRYVPVLDVRRSTSDAQLLAQAGYNVIEVGPQGSGAHTPFERVSADGIAMIIRILEEIVSGRAFS